MKTFIHCLCAAQVWFPTNYEALASPFAGMSTYAYLGSLLSQAPAVPWSNPAYGSWVPQGVLVSAAGCLCRDYTLPDQNT
jgi:hypothetical protein